MGASERGSDPVRSEHIRIERVVKGDPGGASIAKRDRYIFVAEDGTETEISRIMRGVELSALAGEMWQATFKTPFIHLIEVEE